FIEEFLTGITGKLDVVLNPIMGVVEAIQNPAQVLDQLANGAINWLLNFLIESPPSAILRALLKGVSAAVRAGTGKTIVDLLREHVPVADVIIDKVAKSSVVQTILEPLRGPAEKVAS